MDWEIPLLNIGYIVSVVGILCLIFSRLVLSMFFLLILVLAVVTWNSSVDFSFFGFFYTSFLFNHKFCMMVDVCVLYSFIFLMHLCSKFGYPVPRW